VLNAPFLEAAPFLYLSALTGQRVHKLLDAIVGVADAVSPTGELDIRGQALEAAVAREALADAGLTLADVDGVTYAGQVAPMAEYLGVHPRFVDGTAVGGSSFEIHVEHAAAAIAAGLCDVVLGVYAATPRSDRRRPGGSDSPARFAGSSPPGADWDLPYGLRVPIGAYALAASRHIAVYGTTSEQLARIAVVRSPESMITASPFSRIVSSVGHTRSSSSKQPVQTEQIFTS
jgi:hypothetical protein